MIFMYTEPIHLNINFEFCRDTVNNPSMLWFSFNKQYYCNVIYVLLIGISNY